MIKPLSKQFSTRYFRVYFIDMKYKVNAKQICLLLSLVSLLTRIYVEKTSDFRGEQ